MRKDPKEFRERFQRWKAGEQVYKDGLPAYEDGKEPGKINWSRWDDAELTSYPVPFIDEKRITLTNAGRATGAVLSTNLLDSIADNANRAGLPLQTALGLAVKESTLGNPTDDRTAWNLSSGIRQAFNNKYPGTEQHINYWGDALNEREDVINYHKGHQSDDPASGHKSVLQEAFEFYNQHPDKYNPGQKNYPQLVDKRGTEVMGSPEVQKWLKERNLKKATGRFNRINPLLNESKFNLPKFRLGTEGDDWYKYVQAGKNNEWSRITNDYMSQAFQDLVVRPQSRGGNTTVGNWKKQWTPKYEKPLETVSPEFEVLSLGGGIKQMVNAYKHIPGLKIKNLKQATTSWIHQPKKQPYVRKQYSATWDDFQTEPKFGKYFAEGGEAEVYESFDNPGYLTKVKLKIPEEGVTLEDLEYAVNRDLKMNQLPGVEPMTYKGFSTPKIIRKSLKQDPSFASDEFVPIWEQRKLTPLTKTKVGSFDKTTYDDLIREWIARNGYKEDVLSNMLNYGNITISDYVPKNFAFDAFGNMKLIDPMIQTF